MNYDFIAISDAEVPFAVEPVFHHAVTTYASEANKTVSMWRAVPDNLLDFKPHEKTNPIRTILVHQLLSERRFFGQFVGTEEPLVEQILPSGEKPTVQAYIDKYLWLVKGRLPQLAAGTTSWWLEQRNFFGGLQRERIWVFWRRVLIDPLQRAAGRLGSVLPTPSHAGRLPPVSRPTLASAAPWAWASVPTH